MSYADQVKRNVEKFEREEGGRSRVVAYDWRAEYQRELEEEQDGTKYRSYDYGSGSGYSASGSFAKWGSSWSAGKDVHEKSAKALREAARAANVVRGRFGIGKDKSLAVQWSDGTNKNLTGKASDTIFLSPDIIDETKTAKPNWSDDQLNDALQGDALLGAGLKKIRPHKVIAEFQALTEGKKKDVTKKLWDTSDQSKAIHEVLDDYKGFAPYFKAITEYRTVDGYKEELEQRLKHEAPSSKNAADLWAWNNLHPDKTIAVPAAYADAIKYADKQFDKTKTSDERLLASQRIAADYFKRFNEVDEPQPQGQQSPQNDQDGTSQDQLGQPVPNSVDGDLGKDKVDCEEGGNQADTSIRKEIKHKKAWGQQQMTYIDARGNLVTAETEYKNIVLDAHEQIEQLKHKLRFRAAKRSKFEMGCRSGEIDENSLFMLGVDKQEDKLFMRREALEQARVAFTILVDESSSMQHTGHVGSPIWEARKLAVTLIEALTSFEGIHLQVFGHSASLSQVELTHYYTPENRKERFCVASMNGKKGTDEGTAIAAAAKLAMENFRQKNVARNILISISDGGTNVPEAKAQVDRAFRNGVEVYGCGICNPYTEAEGMQLYGQGRFVILKDAKAANVLGSFISKVATTV